MQNINTLFPISIYDKDIKRDFSDLEMKLVLNLAKNVNKNNENYISKDKNILDFEEFFNIKKFILECLDDYLILITKPKNKLFLKITESWMNFTNKDEKHHRHHHPNSVVSGFFYFNCIENDSIVFYNNLSRFSTFEIEVSEYTLLNSHSYTYPVYSGKLLLFPSQLEHEVLKNNNLTPKTRISLSFNTIYEGVLSTCKAQSLNI